MFAMAHLTVVVEVHAVVAERVNDNCVLAVKSTVPKLKPSTVTKTLLESGRLSADGQVAYGASKVRSVAEVPTTAATVKAVPVAEPYPTGLHRILVVVDHVDVPHTSRRP